MSATTKMIVTQMQPVQILKEVIAVTACKDFMEMGRLAKVRFQIKSILSDNVSSFSLLSDKTEID